MKEQNETITRADTQYTVCRSEYKDGYAVKGSTRQYRAVRGTTA